jgi:hypothetical protein
MGRSIFSRTIRLLAADVERTLGVSHAEVVARRAAQHRKYDLAEPAKLVDDVQQEFHDTFVDTTWPTCPRHHRHPLWYHEGSWWCEADKASIAPLGRLTSG